ncbi:hypothetical protein [Microbacterium sp. NPDC080220]|uniref:hypothetical protein n=1 Tax=Microbacterium sp. NPDC080220 TaxID=3161017 RepID=UPI0034424B4D
MSVEELMAIVREESLDAPVLYGVGDVHMNAVLLTRTDAQWQAWVSDERGGVMGRTLQTFDTESAALEYVLFKLRQVTPLRRKLAAWRS